MLRVTVELLPHGDITEAQKLETLYIVNNGTGTEALGNYFVSIKDYASGLVTATTEIQGYQRSRGATELVRQSLNALPKRH